MSRLYSFLNILFRAQIEVDKVLGEKTMMTDKDLEKLSYIEQVRSSMLLGYRKKKYHLLNNKTYLLAQASEHVI